jgi:2-hydroxychromene-2-carboxylate isomerase
MDPIDFFFDFVSPYSYLAHSQLGTLDAPVRLAPFAVLELMKLVNNTPTTVTCPVKRAYAGKDLARWSAHYGVPVVATNMKQLDGGLLLRVATAANPGAERAAVVDAIFKGVWGAQGDPSPEGLAALLAARGLPAADLIAAAGQPAAAEALAAETKVAAELGVFGAPTIRVAGELYFGNDRLDFVREALAKAPTTEAAA